MPTQSVQALSKRYNGISESIITPVELENVFTKQAARTTGIWDTGATGSVVTKSMASMLGLKPIKRKLVRGVHGVKEVNVYPVKITLNNKNITLQSDATECDELFPDKSVGLLIGMNIITKGDFVVTNYQGSTVMTFRVPSLQKIDFVAEITDEQ
ncbi:MAG: retropepsin-like domain-containing protein [Prevotellaceae bacterium]|jgi:predicted aspartyl protease|nr:retropepsin-like domain-containing protein [Prevotellaceae bacterium]